MPNASSIALETPDARRRRESLGLWLGLLGVMIFAMTFPMTRLAVGSLGAPQLSPLFVTAARACGAGLLSLLYLRLSRAARPDRDEVGRYALCAAGTVIGFPLFAGLALREVPAMHAAVITGVLPLSTAVIAAWHLRQRPSLAFWACAGLGCALVIGFAVWQGGGAPVLADLWLLLAVLSASVGYVAGAQLSVRRPAEHVISWVLVGSLPFTVPFTLWSWPQQPVLPTAWAALAYVTVFSMWLGFFAWYRALVIGGTVRVSQVQLVQPFLALLMAVPILGEPLEPATVVFALAVMATVLLGKRMPVQRGSAQLPSASQNPRPH